MSDIESLIAGSEKLTSIFGYWPSFHDARIIDLHFWSGDVDPDQERYTFPILTVKLHVWELTEETDSKGGLVCRHHTLTTLRFHDVDDFKLEGFDHLNEILELSIVTQERGKFLTGEDLPPYIVVHFQPALPGSTAASFRCFRVEVVDAVACTEDGKVLT